MFPFSKSSKPNYIARGAEVSGLHIKKNKKIFTMEFRIVASLNTRVISGRMQYSVS